VRRLRGQPYVLVCQDNGGFASFLGRNIPGENGIGITLEAFRMLGIDSATCSVEETVRIVSAEDGAIPGREERMRRWLLAQLPQQLATEQ
jgi:hypothetical protein